MKKFIPFFSIVIGVVSLQNCTHRDDDLISNNEKIEKPKPTINSMAMKQDSAKSIEAIKDPETKDPPVRDGDNWRLTQN
ncbi:hypothetical protein EGY05_12735 [Chryseobacterium arthrosphaerae]|uniref:hypothetical protein n=1 Tax=Chryseobacterium arthrosphaerae TaxID=651561 RepID=UPI000F4EE342|nr:hypothetical protein [Chryseobacterium arthrosphaerae]AYZ12734.1 hypothetical protein EGY05_12735 [Chryseobacterium arthrosphaerae]